MVSPLLENNATPEEREAGLDLADYLLRPKAEPDRAEVPLVAPKPFQEATVRAESQNTTTGPERASVDLPKMILTEAEVAMAKLISRNPAIQTLIDILDLDVPNSRVTKLKSNTP